MSLLGWGSLALGAYTAYQGSQASSAQASSMSDANKTSQDALDFQKAQYQHAQDVYGPTEQNLAEYYQSLTPEEYTAKGLDAYDTQFQQATESWNTQMAQRGLSGSGIEAEGMMGMSAQGAQDRAQIQQQAPQQWASDQMSWLGLGMGQQNVASQGMANAQSNMANLYSNQAGVFGQQASAAGQSVGNLMGSVMQANAYQPGSVSLWGNSTIPNANNSWTYNNPSVSSGAISY